MSVNRSDGISHGQNKIWEHFQNARPEAFEGARPRLDAILREVCRRALTQRPTLLNIGTGNGYLETHARGLGWDVSSVDPDGVAVKKLRERDIHAFQGTIESLPFPDEHFDFVIASEVLEHLSPDQFRQGLMEIARVLKQEGVFVGTVPYEEDLALNQAVCPHCGLVFHRWGHEGSFDLKTMGEELSKYFQVLVLRARAFADIQNRGVAGKIKGLARLVLGRLGVAIAQPNIYFVAKRKPPSAKIRISKSEIRKLR